MSNSRPPLQRKQTRATEKARKEELDLGVSISVDGRVYTVRQGDMTSMDAMHLRRETGFSFRGLLTSFASDPDIDLIAALVWLARRMEGERLLSFEEVASEIGYDVEIDTVEQPDEETSPEA